MQRYTMYIGGAAADAAMGRWMASENPFSGEVWAEVAQGGADDADRAVRVAHDAFGGPWKELTASARGLLLHNVGDLILRDARKLAATIDAALRTLELAK